MPLTSLHSQCGAELSSLEFSCFARRSVWASKQAKKRMLFTLAFLVCTSVCSQFRRPGRRSKDSVSSHQAPPMFSLRRRTRLNKTLGAKSAKGEGLRAPCTCGVPRFAGRAVFAVLAVLKMQQVTSFQSPFSVRPPPPLTSQCSCELSVQLPSNPRGRFVAVFPGKRHQT
jgi:hypothetical protein